MAPREPGAVWRSKMGGVEIAVPVELLPLAWDALVIPRTPRSTSRSDARTTADARRLQGRERGRRSSDPELACGGECPERSRAGPV